MLLYLSAESWSRACLLKNRSSEALPVQVTTEMTPIYYENCVGAGNLDSQNFQRKILQLQATAHSP